MVHAALVLLLLAPQGGAQSSLEAATYFAFDSQVVSAVARSGQFVNLLDVNLTRAYLISEVILVDQPRMFSYSVSVGTGPDDLDICALGPGVDGSIDYRINCLGSGQFMRIAVAANGDPPLNITNVRATLLDPNFAGRVASVVSDPWDGDVFWWLGNCPASKCDDGNTGALQTQGCGSATTNLCHTAYVDQIHSVTFTLISSFLVSAIAIFNKPGGHERLRNYTISVGNRLDAMSICAEGSSTAGVDEYYHECGLSGSILQLAVDNEGTNPINIREINAVLQVATSPAPPPLPPSSPHVASPELPPAPPAIPGVFVVRNSTPYAVHIAIFARFRPTSVRTQCPKCPNGCHANDQG